MKKILLAMLIMLIAVGAALCGGGPKDLHVYTWSECIDHEIYVMFEKETGIQVVEDIFGSNEDPHVDGNQDRVG